VIALVVRAGLHELAEARRLESPPPSAVSPVSPAATPIASAAVPAGPSEPSDQVAAERAARDRAAGLRDRVVDAFGDQSSLYQAACPLKPDPARPFRPRVELVFTLDAQGQEIRREVRGVIADEKLVACLRSVKAPPIHIAPPGKESQVALQLLLS